MQAYRRLTQKMIAFVQDGGDKPDAEDERLWALVSSREADLVWFDCLTRMAASIAAQPLSPSTERTADAQMKD